jgi:hypothetical protein
LEDEPVMADDALKSEFSGRVNRFQLLLRKDDIDGALLVQKTDLFFWRRGW